MFRIKGQTEGQSINFKPPAGAPAGRVRIRRPPPMTGGGGGGVRRPGGAPIKMGGGGGGARPPPSRRDDFGQPSDDDDDSASDDDDDDDDVSGSESDDNLDEDADDDFSKLANQDRLIDRSERRAQGGPRVAPPPQAFASSASAMPPPRPRPVQQQQPDFMSNGGAADDGFVEANDKSLDQQKLELLHTIQRMAASGNPPQVSLSMDSSFEQIQQEYRRLKKNAEITRSIKFQRRVLLAVSTGVEFVSKKAGFMKLKLDGFSESVLDSIADYDQPFEEIHEKYGDTVSVDPMYSVFFMFVSSIVAYHISNSLFSTVLPSVTQTLSNNPEVLRQVTEAMQSINKQTAPAQPAVVVDETPNKSMQHIVQQMMPPMGFPQAPPPPVFGGGGGQGGFGPDPPRATRVETIVEEHFLQPQPPRHDDEDARSVSVVSEGGTRTNLRGRKKPPSEDTLIL